MNDVKHATTATTTSALIMPPVKANRLAFEQNAHGEEKDHNHQHGSFLRQVIKNTERIIRDRERSWYSFLGDHAQLP
jgi:hypothetical protein